MTNISYPIRCFVCFPEYMMYISWLKIFEKEVDVSDDVGNLSRGDHMSFTALMTIRLSPSMSMWWIWFLRARRISWRRVVASIMKTKEEPRLIVEAVRRPPAESLIILVVAAELPQTKRRSWVWKIMEGEAPQSWRWHHLFLSKCSR